MRRRFAILFAAAFASIAGAAACGGVQEEILWLARLPAYAGGVVLYACAPCVASVLAHGRRSPLIVVAGPLTRPAHP